MDKFLLIIKILPWALSALGILNGIFAKFRLNKKDETIKSIEAERDYEKEKSAKIIENVDQVMDYESNDDKIRGNAEKHIQELKGAKSDKATKEALNNLRSDLYNTYHSVKL